MIPALRRTATGHPLRVVFAAAAGLLVFLQLYAGSSNVVAVGHVSCCVVGNLADWSHLASRRCQGGSRPDRRLLNSASVFRNDRN